MSYNFSEILKFLTAIRKNNNREWFQKNKESYLKVKESFENFLEIIHSKLLVFDPNLSSINPRKAAFRIYRDVRFSKDKRPYKTNMGAGLSSQGKMQQEPGYYIHIEPGNCFVAAGLYQPDRAILSKVRQEIDYNSAAFKKIINTPKFKKTVGKLEDFDKGKMPPKGYPKDHPDLELLKHKSFIVSHTFTNDEVMSTDFDKKVVTLCKEVKPFVDFFRKALA